MSKADQSGRIELHQRADFPAAVAAGKRARGWWLAAPGYCRGFDSDSIQPLRGL